MNRRLSITVLAVAIASTILAGRGYGQGYGSNLQNLLTPADGGMAGVSIAQPQDLQSAIGGNPATLTQFKGTQFSMGGAGPKAIRRFPTTARSTAELPSAPPRGLRASSLPRLASRRTMMSTASR